GLRQASFDRRCSRATGPPREVTDGRTNGTRAQRSPRGGWGAYPSRAPVGQNVSTRPLPEAHDATVLRYPERRGGVRRSPPAASAGHRPEVGDALLGTDALAVIG